MSVRVGPVEADGWCTVLVTRDEPDPGVHVLLDLGVPTGDHPLLMTPEPDGTRRSVVVRLPAETTLSHRFVHTRRAPGPLTDDDERRWLADAGLPDDDPAVERIGPVFGRAHGSGVLTGPRAWVHPAFDPAGPVLRTGTLLDTTTSSGRRVRVAAPASRPTRTLVLLLDGDDWADGLGLAAALDRWHRDDVTVAMVSTPDRGVLADRDRVPAVLAEVLAVVPHVPARVRDRVVAGQSLGGLAAAAAVVDAPHLAATAVVQSGSFWVDGDHGDRDGTRPGLLTRTLTRTTGRFVLQSGTDEPDVGEQTAAFAAAAVAAGGEVDERTVVGGHDHAWYRHHLLGALETLTDESRVTA